MLAFEFKTPGPVALWASLIQSVCASGPEVKAVSCITIFSSFLFHLLLHFSQRIWTLPMTLHCRWGGHRGLMQTEKAQHSTKTIAQKELKATMYIFPTNGWIHMINKRVVIWRTGYFYSRYLGATFLQYIFIDHEYEDDIVLSTSGKVNSEGADTAPDPVW